MGVASLTNKSQAENAQMKMMQHLGYHCPGLHGKSSRQDIRPMLFGTLFTTEQIVIPLFQRAYCWGQSTSFHQVQPGRQGKTVRLVDAWWRDVVRSSEANTHSVGKVVFRRDPHSTSARPPLLCIDGQQRCTTNQLLLAAIRDAALLLLRIDPAHAAGMQLVESINTLLYVDVQAAHEWTQARCGEAGKPILVPGERLPFARLIPSWTDRLDFFEMIMSGTVNQMLWTAGAAERTITEQTQSSHQGQAKTGFDQSISSMLSGCKSVDAQFKALSAVTTQACLGMKLMYIEILNEINLPQVFLWMQEKSLLGSGSLCFNAQPGVAFQGSDMVRNLVLSCYMDRPLDEQEEVFHKLWIKPLDSKFKGDAMDQMLRAFIEFKHAPAQASPMLNDPCALPELSETADADTTLMPPPPPPPRRRMRVQHNRASGRHVSATEKLVAEMTRQMSAEKSAGLVLYVRYVSLVEEIHARVLKQLPDKHPARAVDETPAEHESNKYGVSLPGDDDGCQPMDLERARLTEAALEEFLNEMGMFAQE